MRPKGSGGLRPPPRFFVAAECRPESNNIWEYAINSEPTNVHDKKKSQHTAPDYWALHPTTGLCTQLLGFAPDDWALDPTTGLSPDYWAFTRISRFCLKPNGAKCFRPTYTNKPFPIEIPAITNGILPYSNETHSNSRPLQSQKTQRHRIVVSAGV